MYCRQCGTKNEDGVKFCGGCGAPMPLPKEGTPKKEISKKETSKKKPKGKKGILIALIILLLAICIAAAVIIAMQKKKEKDFETNIEKAENYLEDLEYEKAEDCYLAAIEIDPKDEEPYLRLAEIYTAQNEPEKAVAILEQGLEETESEKIEQKYEIYTYVEDVLIPDLGEVEPGNYECAYVKEEYFASSERVSDLSGVITSRMMDFDNDGEEELLVAVLRNDAESTSGETCNSVYLEMYECNEDGVEKAAEYLACQDILGGSDEESSGVFLKIFEDTIYICGGDYTSVYMFADGCGFRSFVVTYEDGEFELYTGTPEGEGGSEFSHLEDEKDEMADKLEAIDLPKAAESVRSTYMTRMTYEDDVDDMLFRIDGENVGGNSLRYSRTESISSLGKLVIEFWIGGKTAEEDESKAEEKATISAEELESLREELDELYASTEAEIDAAQNSDMMTIRSAVGSANGLWEEEMAYILDIVCSYMSEEEEEALLDDQQAWETESNAQAEESAAQFEGGSMQPLEYAAVMYELTVERCYELLDMLE